MGKTMEILDDDKLLKPETQLLLSFLETALWAETDSEGDPLEDGFSFENIDQNSADMVKTVCNEFIEKAGNAAILENGYLLAGHDLYLTLTGHGAGFWDGDWPENGEKLTEICGALASHVDIYDDSGTLYIDISP